MAGSTDVDAIAGIGREATPNEIKAWDIDVRPDFQGLPPGQGSVEEGESIWLEKCAVCHGDFGDSNEIFSPLVLGNITAEDIETGRVASLTDPGVVRTTLMKVSTVSTLWDYIYRAMPWNAPKSLAPDEVYALVAYLLQLAYVVDYDFSLSDENIEDVQAIMPNRNGVTTDHGLWSVDGETDVMGSDCTSNCVVPLEVTSSIPDYAMNAHGNLKDQMRDYGPFPGIQTAPENAPVDVDVDPVTADRAVPEAALQSNGCLGCHRLDSKLVGPSFAAIAEKYAGQPDAADYLASKIRQGGSGVWGSIAMPPMPQLAPEAVDEITDWLVAR
ncbi:cytochrome c, class I [Luminiphilus syltensis NOR5-1B]|uniref:Cytochrome c-551 n=2 Tax=Luminiphilus TaxID=1341118 RepID=B8KX44_9GAMM|nr:cytochrome c, class I [Luminiphilus syltensis NOR5-1B]